MHVTPRELTQCRGANQLLDRQRNKNEARHNDLDALTRSVALAIDAECDF
jgi:hypothetical protein